MKKKVILVVGILFGLMFLNSGLNKFFNYIPVPDDLPESMTKLMDAFSEIGWIMPLVAVVEIIGGILFMIGRTRALGAIIIFPVMTGILLTHIVNAPSGLIMALVLMAVNLWIIYEYRAKYLPMIRQ